MRNSNTDPFRSPFDLTQPAEEEEKLKNSSKGFSLTESQETLQLEIADDIFNCLWYGQLTFYAKEFSTEDSDHRNRRNPLFGWSFDPLLDVLLKRFGGSKERKPNPFDLPKVGSFSLEEEEESDQLLPLEKSDVGTQSLDSVHLSEIIEEAVDLPAKKRSWITPISDTFSNTINKMTSYLFSF